MAWISNFSFFNIAYFVLKPSKDWFASWLSQSLSFWTFGCRLEQPGLWAFKESSACRTIKKYSFILSSLQYLWNEVESLWSHCDLQPNYKSEQCDTLFSSIGGPSVDGGKYLVWVSDSIDSFSLFILARNDNHLRAQLRCICRVLLAQPWLRPYDWLEAVDCARGRFFRTLLRCRKSRFRL